MIALQLVHRSAKAGLPFTIRTLQVAVGARPFSTGITLSQGRVANKLAIVTGGAHGIGKATATLFAAEGATVIIADRDTQSGAAVARLIRERGGKAEFIKCDVSDESSVESLMVKAAEIGNGNIHALVNVAGVDIIAKLEDTSTDRWDRVMTVNLRSVFLTCRYALPYLKAAERSSIVNISSIQAHRGFSGYPGYAATKAGILGFSRQIAVDYAQYGIRVNSVSPGPVVTDLAATSVAHEPDFPPLESAGAPDIVASEKSAVELDPPFDPTPRLFTASIPMDIAYPILWLTSDEAAAVTGTEFVIDGGFTIKGIASLQHGHDPAKSATMAEPT
eukprot:m.41089 g.41089  ORF g.41089 m.41089 type:complete len:333 (-) comp18699_c0_seq1:78-1076(-)